MDSAFFWKGSNMSHKISREGAKKNPPKTGKPKVKCLFIDKQDHLVNYLKERRVKTTQKAFSNRKHICLRKTQFTQNQVTEGITNIIHTPHRQGMELKLETHTLKKIFFGLCT